MYAVRTYLLFPVHPLSPSLSLWHLELPVARVLHMFVPFLTSDWLIRVLVWFIYKTSFLHSSQVVIFFPSVSTVFPNQTFLLSLYIGPHFSSHSRDIETRSSILKCVRNNTPNIQDSSFKAKHLFFEKVLSNLEIIFYVA